MPHVIEPSTIRILKPTGETVGTGFLVSKTLAVTCAHVVVTADALDGDTIQVQFAGQDEKIFALVVPEYWRDLDKGDVAFLRVETVPAGVTPLRLGLASQSRSGTAIYSFGYTTAAGIQGIIAHGTIDGYLPQHTLLQFQSPQANHGISGGPVLDEKRGVVVGLITRGHTESGRNAQTTFATPTELLFEICPEICPSETCPYLGLDAFSEADARFFHGRRRVVARLLESLKRNPRFLAVLGPSGSGKSSVVQAGLLPELRNGALIGSEKWAFFQIRPGDNPFIRLDSAGWQETGFGLVAALDTWTKAYPETYPVLVVDQFEELFTSTPTDLRENFLRGLAELLESNLPVTLILTLRDDFYSTFTRQSAALTRWLERGQVNVEATLGRDDLCEMITAPAELLGLGFETGLVETLLDDVTGSQSEGASTLLPLLEFALMQLWEHRVEGLLTHAAYQKLGGVTGGLTSWADHAYHSIPAGQRNLVRHVLTYLVHLGDEKQNLPDTRRRMTLADLTPFGASADEVRGVVKALADARLLVTHGDEIEITHEILLRSWPQLREWLEEDRENLRIREGVSEAAKAWRENPQNVDLLVHRGGRLEDALKLRGALNTREQTYLNACKTAIQRRRQVTIASISLAMLVIMAVLAGWGWSSNDNSIKLRYQVATSDAAKVQADNQKATAITESNIRATAEANAVVLSRISISRQLAAQSISMLDQRPDLPLLLAIEAHNFQDNPETKNALLSNLQSYPYLLGVLDMQGTSADYVALQSNGKLLAVATGKTVALWDISDRNHPLKIANELEGHTENISNLAFHPGKNILASASLDKTVILWDISNPKKPVKITSLTDHPDYVEVIAFGASGNLLVSGCYDGTVILWNISDPYQPVRLWSHQMGDGITDIALRPDEKVLAVAEVNTFDPNSITFFDISNLSEVVQFDAPITGPLPSDSLIHGDFLTARTIMFSPNGQVMAEGTDSGYLILWDMKEPAKPTEISKTAANLNSGIAAMAFDPAGKLLATSGTDNGVTVWDVSSPGQPTALAQLNGHSSNVESLAFGPGGNILISAGINALLWDIADIGNHAQLGTVMDKSMGLADVLYSPDDETLVANTDSKDILVWKVERDTFDSNRMTQVADLTDHKGYILGMDFSSDGKLLATGSTDKTIILWDFSDPNHPKKINAPLAWHTSNVNSVSISPDDQTLASGGADKQVFLWDIRNPKEPQRTGILSGFVDSVQAVEFSPNGQILAVADNSSNVSLWNVTNLKNVKRISNFKVSSILTQIAFHPKQAFLATLLYDKVQFWDISEPANPQKIGQPFPDKPDQISRFALSPDGNTLVGANDQVVAFWDISDPARPVKIGRGASVPNGYVNNFSFRSDGKVMVSGSEHNLEFVPRADGSFNYVRPQLNSIVFWDIDMQSWIERACQRVGRNLTYLEWTQYLPSEAYRATCPKWPLETKTTPTP